jgi:hypothetical protein
MTKMKESESSGTKVQIFKSCIEPHDEDLRVLETNWMKKEVKGMKYSQGIITYQLSN